MDFFGLILIIFVFWLYYKLIKAVVKFIKKLPNIYLFENKINKNTQYKSYHIQDIPIIKTEPIDISHDEFYGYDLPKKEIVSDISQFVPRKALTSLYENDFLVELKKAWSDDFDIYPQVQLGAIFRPVLRIKNWGPLSRLNKRIDFLLVDKYDQTPVLAIELDDSTHEKEKRRIRDRFVEDLFMGNNIPFVRYNHGYYSCSELKNGLSKVLGKIKSI